MGKFMKADLFRYRHYLLMLLALLLANYLLVPLTEFQQEQQQSLSLLKKKQVKTDSLFGKDIEFTLLNKQLDDFLKNAHKYIYSQQSEADFKLIAQTQIENHLKEAGCNISRIGFKGSQQITPNVDKWYMDIRYGGDVSCLIGLTRGLETSKPYINIEEYSYSVRDFDKRAKGDFNAKMSVSVWYKLHSKENEAQR